MGADGTIRVWDIATHAQLCGFDSHTDPPLCCTFLPNPLRRDVACGFQSGRLRIFDTAKMELVQVGAWAHCCVDQSWRAHRIPELIGRRSFSF